MGKPVICPHCNKFFVSDNEPGNPFCLCPQCGRWMNIGPIVKKRKRPKPSGPTKCPFCGAEMAPGSDTCLKCQRQIITGEKLPLLRRLALVPTSKKMIALCGALGFLVVIVVVVNLVVTWTSGPSQPEPGPKVAPDSPEAITARGILNDLLESRNEAEQARLAVELGRVGPAAVGLVLEALDQREPSEGVLRALIVALGDIGDPRGADVVADAMRSRRFRHTAMISLALMGDQRAAMRMIDYFTEQVEQVALGRALVKRSLLPVGVGRDVSGGGAVETAALQREWTERLNRLQRPLAALGESVLSRLLATYWTAWGWPARDRGNAWLEQLARITSRMTFSEGTPNEAIEALLVDQPADVRLAAALLLKKRRAGSRRSAETWASKIADLLAGRRLEVRQRAVWTITTITDKTFGRFGADQSPTRVPATAVTEAADWIRRRTGREVSISLALLAEHRAQPSITRRTYHPARAAARRLVEGLAPADWPTVRARWRELTVLPADAAPVVRELLDGGVRRLKVPARLVVLMLLAQWRDRDSARLMGPLANLQDNPAWIPACVAVARASAERGDNVKRWLDPVAKLDPDQLAGKDPDRGLVPADLGRLIAPQGRAALTAMHRDGRFTKSGGSLIRVYHTAIDAMINYGWPASVWLEELGG